MCCTPTHAKIFKMHLILENWLNTESKVVDIFPGFLNTSDMDNGKIAFTMCLCKDNSAFIKNIDSDPTEPKCTLYPPPSAQLIKKLVYSSRLDRYIILLSSSTMCVYKLYRETALLEVIQDPNEIRDCEGKRALSQTVTCMELV